MAHPSPRFETEGVRLFQGDCLEILGELPEESFDLVFADPPYMLSNDGFTCKNGRAASVNKGEWDRSRGVEEDYRFHTKWLSACRRVLRPGGTLWVSGTYHSIYACGHALQALGYHILNEIVWYKPNASPNLSCRMFTASHETLIWARRDKKAKHYFDYHAMTKGHFPKDWMKEPGKQMRSVWAIPTTPAEEKALGSHPTQKPLALLDRIIRASCPEGGVVLDPFSGSGTTLLAAVRSRRQAVGIELESEFISLSIERLSAAEISGPPLFDDSGLPKEPTWTQSE